MVLQDQPLRMLQQIIEGVDFGVDQLTALVLGLDGSRVGQSASSPHQGELSRVALASLPYAARSKGLDWFSCFHILGAGSLPLTPPGPSLLVVLPGGGSGATFLRATAGEGQGQLWHLSQVVKGWGRKASFPCSCHHMAVEGAV